MAEILDGKAVAQKIKQNLKKDVDDLKKDGIIPKGITYDFLIEHKMCNPDDLVVFAKLTTTRIDIKEKDHEFAIDKSEYGKTDYEVECEANSMKEAISYLKEFLEKENIPFEGDGISKLKRVKQFVIQNNKVI